MAVTVRDIRRVLEDVQDPCSLYNGTNLSIVDMGMVRDVKRRGGRVEVSLLLTEPTCIYFFEISRQIKEKVLAMPGISEVDVTSVTGVLWTAELMADGARERLRRQREDYRTRHGLKAPPGAVHIDTIERRRRPENG